MHYKKFSPATALRPYVKSYYILEHNAYLQTPVELRSPPSGLAGMVFNYGDAGCVLHKNGERIQNPTHFVAGQFRKSYTLRLKGQIGMVGVIFWPAALPHLFGIPMIKFTGQRVDLSLVLGSEADLLREQILEHENSMDRIHILDHFLLKKLHQACPKIDIVDRAVHTILNEKGILSIRELSDDLCISRRQFRRRFKEKVGIRPKLFARIKRFNYISHYMLKDGKDWADVVYQGCYYDQSHFIRDFYEFSGKNPSEFMDYNRNLAQLVET